MLLSKLNIINFRCFEQIELELNSQLILIEGENGSGKTSILEALHYLGYLKSFRTHITKELISMDSDGFFIKALFNDNNNENNDLQVGFSGKKRLVKINNKSVQSYKELMNYYRVITLTQDDLNLIREGPDVRRSFIDQHIMLGNPQFLSISRKYKQILDNRNALLRNGYCKYETYLLWTEQLWRQSVIIQNMRINALKNLEIEVNRLFYNYFARDINTNFIYEPKGTITESFDDFIKLNPDLYENEQRQSRSLIGAHLDDFGIVFLNKKSKIFASRGQQKLIILLIKVAQIIELKAGNSVSMGSIIFLLDDFMTDFDIKRIQLLMPLLFSLDTQLIFTCPTEEGPLKKLLLEKKALIIPLKVN